MFVTDVGTDIFNGKQRNDEDYPIWGFLMLGFIFLPASIVCCYFALENVIKVQKGCKAKLKWIFISMILYIPSIIVTTFLGFVYVIYAGCRKIIHPGWKEKKFKLENFSRELGSGELRMCEILFESNPQAILGITIRIFCNCICIVQDSLS